MRSPADRNCLACLKYPDLPNMSPVYLFTYHWPCITSTLPIYQLWAPHTYIPNVQDIPSAPLP